MDAIISPEAMAGYKQSARLREEQQRAGARKRREMAWSVAHVAADLLKRQFGAGRVILYGSMAHGHWFGPRSDIDLAEDGIKPTDFWRAWSALDPIAQGFEINLIALESATGSLRRVIEMEGIDL
jgi:predicted nucleotidyltransferase